MKIILGILPKAHTSLVLIFIFLNLVVGCNYYRVVKDKKTPLADQARKLAQQGGDPSGINRLKPGTDVVMMLKDSSIILSRYIAGDDKFVYFGKNAKLIDRTIPISDIRYIQKSVGKYFILHDGTRAWHMKYVILSEDKSSVITEVDPVGEKHKAYLTARPGGNRYKKAESDPSNEIHIYSHGINPDLNSPVEIPFTQIEKIELFKEDQGTEAVTDLAVLVGVTAIFLVIVALTKSSCPFIYVQDGGEFKFAGESYGGAIYPSLERDDYLPLPGFKPDENLYTVKITNELLEKQYTNLAELKIIEHPKNSSVLLDQYGNTLTFAHPQAPVLAESGNCYNLTDKLAHTDKYSWIFDDPDTLHDELSEIYLSFIRPPEATSGKLILNAKNSLWLDYVYGKFNEQFGTAYSDLVELQKKEPREKLDAWSRAQNIPLQVSIETRYGWKAVDQFHVIGPLASREMIMPIDLSEVEGETIRLKLSTGFMFWEINSAAMDFSKNEETCVSTIQASTAIDENGNDVRASLLFTDKQYLIQEEAGKEVILNYQDPGGSGKRSVFFHSRGYYEYIRNYETSPRWFTIMSFKENGGFTRFAKEQFDQLSRSKDVVESF
ncbi:MAG TPA: hypothetical protein PLR06_10575 [Cyclobacteriaceae bacterium]|nr:hypothetical protein [Cyclobacteriaceae bacterium]